MKWTIENINEAVALHGDGKTFNQIADLIGRSCNAVTRKMNRMGISGFDAYIKSIAHRRGKYWFDTLIIRERKIGLLLL